MRALWLVYLCSRNGVWVGRFRSSRVCARPHSMGVLLREATGSRSGRAVDPANMCA